MLRLATFWHLPPALALAWALLAEPPGHDERPLITRVGMAPFIVTLATMSVFRGLSLLIAGLAPPAAGERALLEWPGRRWIGPIPCLRSSCSAASSPPG
jgi:ribose/xylose/arabinose/galactoside ABC-type transport system permease subunit